MVVKASGRGKWIALAVGVALAIALVISSGKCDRAHDEAIGSTKTDEPALPAPDGLLADVTMGTPNASWAKLQRGIGGAVGILPATAGGIVCAIAGLDPFIASEIDGTAPAYGVIAADPGAAGVGRARGPETGWALAMKLSDVRKARGVLLDGDTARYAGRDAGGMTELVAKGDGSGAPVAVGLSQNGYLLIARRPDDLARLGPYLTRTLPRKPLPSEGAVVLDVPRSAIGSVVKPKLEGLWAAAKAFLLVEDDRMRREHAGRAPDFGDPKAIVAAADAWVTRRISVIGDLEKMRVTVDLVDDGVAVLATMTPAAGGGPAAKWTDGMKTGDSAPVAALPVTSAAALLLRDGEEDRAEQSRDLERALASSLGPRLAEADAKKLHDVVEDMTKARGDVMTSALIWDEPQGLSLRAPVRDPDAASRAVKGALDLAKVPPFKEIFRVRDITASAEEVSGAGKAQLATIAREPAKDPREARARDAGAAIVATAPAPAKRAKKDDLGLAWLVDGGSLSLATGEAPLATLGATVRPERKLGDEPAVARSFTALGANASAVLVVQPLRFDPKRANLPAAPLVIALGRKDKDAMLRIDVAHGLLRELARWQMGL